VCKEEFGLEMCLVYVKVCRDLELRLTTYSDLVMTNLATLLLLLLCLLLTVIYSSAGCYCVVYSAWNIFDLLLMLCFSAWKFYERIGGFVSTKDLVQVDDIVLLVLA